ncbi:hypothetical protein BDN70DRAFT_899563 [Pholiota conissans]|uniref:Uncharacterized protein n=1 Tax=Pholiota conissans TaxID=109636 RepID=A0A9P5YRA3_9AGAR|nr:hypothetical protein BDN70DRAFT_899563 [Pholiota conissans]
MTTSPRLRPRVPVPNAAHPRTPGQRRPHRHSLPHPGDILAGAGTVGFHTYSYWLLIPKPIFPWVSSYTRSERVISMHPLRLAKLQPGEILYRRYCSAMGQTLDITYFGLDGRL